MPVAAKAKKYSSSSTNKNTPKILKFEGTIKINPTRDSGDITPESIGAALEDFIQYDLWYGAQVDYTLDVEVV